MSEIDDLQSDLLTASTILEWEFGEIIGHVGVRLPEGEGISVKMLRVPQTGQGEDWIMQFDMDGNKIAGEGTVPGEAAIYTRLFRAKPEANAIVHAHAPMCIVLGLAGVPVSAVHLASAKFGPDGLPVYPTPVYVSDDADGDAIARHHRRLARDDHQRTRHRDGREERRRGVLQCGVHGANRED